MESIAASSLFSKELNQIAGIVLDNDVRPLVRSCGKRSDENSTPRALSIASVFSKSSTMTPALNIPWTKRLPLIAGAALPSGTASSC